jgi:hypothetical protein
MKVMTPTTAAAIHAPCHNESEISLTLDVPFGYPRPEILSESKEHPASRKGVASASRTFIAVRLN